MQIQLRCVQKRGHSFFFRLAIPADLQVHFHGKKEVSQTLDTTDPLTAFTKSEGLRSAYKAKFDQLRHRQSNSSPRRHLIYLTEPSITPQSPEIAPISPLLSEVLEELMVARTVKFKTILDRKSAIRLLIDWHGDLPISKYTRKMMIDFRDKGMLRLPINVYKDTRYKEIPIRSLAKKHHGKIMTACTVNNKLAHIGTAFNYATKHGYLNRNPAVDLMLRLDKTPSKERDYYSPDQVQRLIDALAENTKTGGMIRHQRYWVTLICLYCGARQNEIAQLQVSDLVIIDGIPCFDITEDGEAPKSLKNYRSERFIPLHPTLIDLGLLRYHQERSEFIKKSSNSSLWYKATSYRDGNWGRKVSRWFGDCLRPAFLTEKELADHNAKRNSYCFHSLRHTFIHHAQNQAQMNPRIEMRLTGHCDAFISEEHARYGKDMHPSILLKELVKLDYGLDLSAVMNRY